MQFIDSHLHLQDYKTNNAPQIIEDLRSKNFVRVVCASSTPQSWKEVALLARNYPDMIIPAFGLHPWYLNEVQQDWLQQLEAYLNEFPQAWVGECGLDRLKAPSEEGQLKVFIEQIKLACRLERSLNIHMLKAEELFKPLWAQMPKHFMLHSFGGSTAFLHQALEAGAMISLSPTVLKRRNGLEIINETPLSRMLLESDGPFLSSYSDIPEFAKKISEIKNIEFERFVSSIYANFEEFHRGK